MGCGLSKKHLAGRPIEPTLQEIAALAIKQFWLSCFCREFSPQSHQDTKISRFYETKLRGFVALW